MKISLKIFLGYFFLVGLAAYFVLNVFVDEVKPGVRQAMEDTLVDSAQLLAAIAAPEVKNGSINAGSFAAAVAQYQGLNPRATIAGVRKQHVDYRVYVTDAHGVVIFDSAQLAVGQDYSKWNDVYLTLRGKYGARSSPLNPDDKSHHNTVMYVAAPVKEGDKIIGVLTVAKANRTIEPFIQRAQEKIVSRGAWLLGLSLLIGVLFTWRLTRAIHRLRDYALAVAQGKKASAPSSSNDELAELATAMHTMRQELDGKQYVQDYIHNLAHELKSPITAIDAATELINEHMPAQDQRRFLNNIKQQSQRLLNIIQNMLTLAELEQAEQLQHTSLVNLAEVMQQQIKLLEAKAMQLGVHFQAQEFANIAINGDGFLIAQAINNLLDNALEFSPQGATIEVRLSETASHAIIEIADQGTGIPDYALDKIFDKYYSLPRPHTGQKSTGLGLNFVREVAHLHQGEITLTNRAEGGVLVRLTIKK